jgi:hypothetical protein
LKAVTPFLPTPVGAPVDLVLGGVSALLALWNVHQHKTLKSLKSVQKVRESFTQAREERPPPSPPGSSATGAPSSS